VVGWGGDLAASRPVGTAMARASQMLIKREGCTPRTPAELQGLAELQAGRPPRVAERDVQLCQGAVSLALVEFREQSGAQLVQR
jgi:hypothetical protein